MEKKPILPKNIKYVVATPRLLRGVVPTALSRLTGKAGLKVVGAANPDRVVVLAGEKEIDALQREFGESLLIEREILYFRQ